MSFHTRLRSHHELYNYTRDSAATNTNTPTGEHQAVKQSGWFKAPSKSIIPKKSNPQTTNDDRNAETAAQAKAARKPKPPHSARLFGQRDHRSSAQRSFRQVEAVLSADSIADTADTENMRWREQQEIAAQAREMSPER